MLSEEQAFFLQILSDHINNKKTSLRSCLNQELLASIAKIQQCEGIVYYQTHIPEMQPSFAADLYYAANREKLMRRIHRLFTDNHISYLIFKGPEMAALYPVPSLRTMGDLDIMVHKRDKQKAHELLLSSGFINECLGPNEWIYHIGDLKFELHHRLMNDELVLLPGHKKFMKSVWKHVKSEDGIQYHIDWNYHLVFLFLHLRKHFMNSGVGFRQFYDVAMVVKCCRIDWDYFGRAIDALGITEFVRICFGFIGRWFGVRTPVTLKEPDGEFYQSATQQIFDNGVFGFDDIENRANYAVIQKMHNGYKRTGYYLYDAFPPYIELCESYDFLKGRPWLIGAVWIYRWGRYVVSLPSKMKERSRKETEKITDAQVHSREKYLKEWGLEI